MACCTASPDQQLPRPLDPLTINNLLVETRLLMTERMTMHPCRATILQTIPPMPVQRRSTSLFSTTLLFSGSRSEISTEHLVRPVPQTLCIFLQSQRLAVARRAPWADASMHRGNSRDSWPSLWHSPAQADNRPCIHRCGRRWMGPERL
jgi:hypothetical protein